MKHEIDVEYDAFIDGWDVEVSATVTFDGDTVESVVGTLFFIDHDGGIFREIEFNDGYSNEIYNECVEIAKYQIEA